MFKKTNKTINLSPQELSLMLVTMIWGASFVAVHFALNYSGPLFFVGYRFALAGLFAFFIFYRCMSGLTLKEIIAGASIGVSICLGYGLQTYGLQTISGSQSGFITALYVPIVPLLQWVLLRRKPHIMSWIGVILAFGGLVLLAGPTQGLMTLGKGEFATLAGAVAIAIEVILISMFAKSGDMRRITVVQLFFGGMLSFLLMPVTGEKIPDFSWNWAMCGVLLAVASALIQLTMNWAQKTISPTRATVIYAGEPVWAGVAGKIAGDVMPATAVYGAMLIVGGVITSELRPRFNWKNKKLSE